MTICCTSILLLLTAHLLVVLCFYVYSMFYHDGVCLSCVSCNKKFTYLLCIGDIRVRHADILLSHTCKLELGRISFTALWRDIVSAIVSGRYCYLCSVVVLCSSPDTVREVMIAADALNFNNGEYVFFSIDLFARSVRLTSQHLAVACASFSFTCHARSVFEPYFITLFKLVVFMCI